jgi:FixJ family two-component response regulator
VTSRYEEAHIREKCERLGVKLIPKAMAGFVPIEIAAPKELLDCVLIDDDKELVHVIWAMSAKSHDLKIKMFSTPSEFFAEAESLDPLTPIYVDVSLGNGVKGTDVATQIHNLGFTEINLTTGYEADSIQVPIFIKKVCGKDFPINKN